MVFRLPVLDGIALIIAGIGLWGIALAITLWFGFLSSVGYLAWQPSVGGIGVGLFLVGLLALGSGFGMWFTRPGRRAAPRP